MLTLNYETAPMSTVIEDLQIAIINAYEVLYKASLNLTIISDKLIKARESEQNIIYCDELEKTFFK